MARTNWDIKSASEDGPGEPSGRIEDLSKLHIKFEVIFKKGRKFVSNSTVIAVLTGFVLGFSVGIMI